MADSAPVSRYRDESPPAPLTSLALLVCPDAAASARLADALGERWAVQRLDAPTLRVEPAPDLVVACGLAGGARILAVLRADLALAGVPFVLVADVSADDEAALLRHGADAVLPAAAPPTLLRAWAGRLVQARAARSAPEPGGASGQAVRASDARFLDRVRQVAQAAMVHPGFSVGDLAHALGVSPRHLGRRLRGLTGETPGALIRRLRMDRAAALLAGGWGVGDVAAGVGFRSRSQFRRAYRRARGELPSETARRPALVHR